VQQYAAYPTIDNNFQLIELDGGSAGTGPAGSGIAYQQTGAAMANFTGSYAMIFADHGQVNDTNWSGILQSNGSSISSATVDADQLSIASLQNVSSNYAIFTQDADATLTGVGLTDQGSGRFSGSLTGTINGSAITVNGEFYMIDSGNLLFLETDANTPGAGTLKLQQLQ
jgi:hypothetical protein